VRRRLSIWLKWTVLAGAVLISAWIVALRAVPFPEEELARIPSSVVLTDREGGPLRVSLGADGLDCRAGYVPEPEQWIVKALVAAEDRRFWSHPGVDGLALLRAMVQNGLGGCRVSGASTLSTQVIRLMEPRSRTLWSKGIEAFRAVQMEQRHGKLEILRQYLNRAPFGGNKVGIESAARRYFGKRAAQLSLAEAALLAGLPQSPSRLRPDRHPERAQKRQAYVLARMEACGFITPQERADALEQPLHIRRGGYPFRAPHFCDWVGVPAQVGATSELRTTLDPAWQQLAETVLRRHAAANDSDGGAVVVLDVKTGSVRAMVGSPDYRSPRAGQVNGAVARRAAGSTLKPFAFALALDQGRLTPATALPDVPVKFRDLDPRNFSLNFQGRVTVRDALVQSLNLPAIEVERQVGQERFHTTLRELGLSTIDQPASHYGLGLVLGNAEVRLLDLVNAYACLARGGLWTPVRTLERDRLGEGKRLFSPEACWLIADMLGGEERAMESTGHAADVRLPPLAWKTGTSAGLRDAWTVAWNPEIVIGVWVGNVDGASSDGLVGSHAATPIAWDLFRQLYPDNQGPWFARPQGIVSREVCAVSGCSPGPACTHRIEDWSVAQVSRTTLCPLHRHRDDAPWPDVARQIASLPQDEQASLRILAPAGGSVFYRMPDSEGLSQQLLLEATSDQEGEDIHWFVDDRPVGKSSEGGSLFWSLERGTHQIVCSTTRGLSDRVQIAVE